MTATLPGETDRTALFDSRAWTAGELAAVTGVARSTASEHLDLLATPGCPAHGSAVSALHHSRRRRLRAVPRDRLGQTNRQVTRRGRLCPGARELEERRRLTGLGG